MSKLELDKRVILRNALREALHELDIKRALPEYLQEALVRYNKARVKRIASATLVPKLVAACHARGAPLSKGLSRKKGAYEEVAERVGLSPSTVERAYRRHKGTAIDPDELDEGNPQSDPQV